MRTVTILDPDEITKILSSQTVCYLGTASSSGLPYVVPMNFGLYNNEIVLHSGPEGRLINVLKENSKVCITFCAGDKIKWQDEHMACSYRVDSTSAIVEGEVRFITDLEEKRLYLDKLMKNYSERSFTYSEPALRNVCVMTVEMTEIGCRKFGVPTHIARKMEGTTLVTKKDDE